MPISAETSMAAAAPVLLSVEFMAKVGITANMGPSANTITAIATIRVTGVSTPVKMIASNNRAPEYRSVNTHA